jgi:hypothetical protein
MYHQELLSWATMHRRWGQAIAPAVASSLGHDETADERCGSDAGPGVPA